mmetsp:Transcript_13854/g.11828  ORF Transcript_13854/g.11828 Transcript_13854/m.11828 type:complete len:144 (+) Transcript_13854:3460-3891(+)
MKIRFELKNSLTYPWDFIQIELPPEFEQPANGMDELLCYFEYTDIYNLKTHRCDWIAGVNPIIEMYAPEEKDFVAGDVIDMTITTRGSNVLFLDGIFLNTDPGDFYVRVATNQAGTDLEEAYLVASLPPCPFNNFLAELAVHQ